jgi:hypothetical protein
MTTDYEIYLRRAADAQARIRRDRDLGWGPTRLDLYRLDLNMGLAKAALQAEAQR